VLKAIIKKISGDDPQRKYDYLTKLHADTVKSLACLSETQLDSTAECQFLGAHFPSLNPLASFVTELAFWSPSKQGKRAEQVTATMINQETHLIPTVLNQPVQGKKQKKEEKEQKE
jgi:hypothetical protein